MRCSRLSPVLLFAVVLAGCPRASTSASSSSNTEAVSTERAKGPPRPSAAPAAKGSLALVSTKPRVERKPENVRSPLGMNVVPPNFMGVEWAFIDSMVSAGWWTSATIDKWGDGRSIEKDEHGWPRSLEPGQRATTIIPSQQGGAMVITYEGKGELEISGVEGPVDDLEMKDGRITFRAKPHQQLIFTIAATNPKDHVRNVKAFPAALEKEVKAGRIFHPTYLDRLAPFKVVRFMDWQKTNGSRLEEWKDRTDPRLYTQAVDGGVAYEYMVLLANTLKIDPWFCLPHAASDDFVQKFATFLRDELDPSLKIYLEYSNEVWHDHPEFSQALFARQQGDKLGLHQDNGVAMLKFQAKRSTEMMKIAEKIIPKERLVRVLGSQLGNHYAHDALIEQGDTKKHVDALAIAAYFGHEVGTHEELLKKNDAKAVLDFLESYSVPWTLDATALSVKWGKKNGIDIIAYEGGQHLVASPDRQNDEAIGRVLDAANADPRMGKAYTRLLDGWKKAGGKLFVHYTFAARPEKYGRFGALDTIDQPREKAPKYDALLKFVEANDRWW